MAIKKKGNTGFLNGTTVERFDNIVHQQGGAQAAPESGSTETPAAAPAKPEEDPVKVAPETPEKPQVNAPAAEEGTVAQEVSQPASEPASEPRKPLTLEDVMGSEELIKQVAQQILKQGGAKGIGGLEAPKQGRPRKELIKGIDEVSVNLQLPETLVTALRKKAKDEKITIKEIIGHAIMSTYPELLK